MDYRIINYVERKEKFVKTKTIAILVISILAVGGIAGFVIYKKLQNREYKRYQRCVALHESEQYSEAIDLLNEFLEDYSKSEYSEDALYRLATAYQSARDYDNAEKTWKRLIEKPEISSERKIEAHFNKGLCQEQLGKIDAAINSYKTVTSLRHTESGNYVASALYHLGKIYEDKSLKSDAADAYRQILQNYPQNEYAKTAAEKLGNWNLEYLLNKNTTIYYVKSGDNLETIARKHNSVPELIKKVNGLETSKISIGQTLRIPQVDFDIEVVLKERVLNLKHNGKIIKQYSICIGDKEHATPEGTFKIINKLVNPEWRSPEGRIVPPNAPDNELGTRWMGIANEEVRQVAGYGIHGTVKPESIGKAESRGCIRMHNQDVEEIFDLVKHGTQVVIKDKLEEQEWYTPEFKTID